MYNKIIIYICLILFVLNYSLAKNCQCTSPILCNPLNIGPRQEFLGFSLSNNTYDDYNWSHLTTIAIFYSDIDPNLICVAHGHAVRVVVGASFPVSELNNQTYQDEWIEQQIQYVIDNNLDGINFDVESPIYPDQSVLAALYTGLVARTTSAFKAINPYYQITVDVAWSPNGIDGRFYDYQGLAQASDFLVVMDYDLRSQVFGDGTCTASANTPPTPVFEGMLNYTALQIPESKLVMGLPWYGYVYECLNTQAGLQTVQCDIALVPFRGVNCSDAAGQQYTYFQIQSILNDNSIPSTGELWSEELSSPYFNYIDPSTNSLRQVWYDNVESLQIKVIIAKKMKLRGVSVWNIDFLSPNNQDPTYQSMWSALNYFFDD